MDTATLLVRGTANASFVCYIIALLWRMRRPSVPAQGLWTVAFGLMLVHVVLAFHFAHQWSHRDAYEETARQTEEVFGLRWGGGVFANYALLLVWAVEVAHWWRQGVSKWAQAFLAFMWFNGTVVFGHGWARWLGVAGFLALGISLWLARRKSSSRDVA